jgi:hypothetical protein
MLLNFQIGHPASITVRIVTVIIQKDMKSERLTVRVAYEGQRALNVDFEPLWKSLKTLAGKDKSMARIALEAVGKFQIPCGQGIAKEG